MEPKFAIGVDTNLGEVDVICQNMMRLQKGPISRTWYFSTNCLKTLAGKITEDGISGHRRNKFGEKTFV